MKLTKKTTIIFGILILVVISIIIFNLSSKNNGPKVYYTDTKVLVGNLKSTISSTGSITPKNRLTVIPPVAGRIEELLVKEGDRVKKGQIIGWMSSSERVALIDAARASGKEELKRWKEIYKAIPLLAAIRGTVISRAVEPGQTVVTSTEVLVIADKLILKSQVDETDVAKIQNGEKAIVILDAYPNHKIMGEVKHIAYDATTSDNVTVYEVDIALIKAPSFMKSGMSAEVSFIISLKENSPYLPVAAIQYDEIGPFVYTDHPDKKAEKTRIKTGIQDGSKIEVLEGVHEGDIVFYPSTQVLVKKDEEENSTNPFLPKPPHRRKKKKAKTNKPGP